jgi:glycerol uptake facilitator protein
MKGKSLSTRCLGEAVGTFILVFLGCGAVHTAVLTGALAGLWQAAVVWALGVMLAIFTVGGLSGAHINPAVTVALAAWGRFSWRHVPEYILAQTLGAFVAAAALFVIYSPYLAEMERAKAVTRGEPGSEITASCYGEYFPNPGPLASAPGPYSPEEHARLNRLVPESAAVFAEFLGTLILAMVIFALTDEANQLAPASLLAPAFIGLTVAALIVVIAPLTQACFNPARDFGPRLFAALAGWGRIALPGPRGYGFLTVYILAPTLGAVVGGGLYDRVIHPRMRQSDVEIVYSEREDSAAADGGPSLRTPDTGKVIKRDR